MHSDGPVYFVNRAPQQQKNKIGADEMQAERGSTREDLTCQSRTIQARVRVLSVLSISRNVL
jgi:hypothetical protein